MKIKLIIEYDGTAYAGWQRQENALAVQQVIEDALTRLTREKIVIAGASRTDAGVHALGQTAHFDTECRIPPDKYSFALNTMLPQDIRIRHSCEADADFHARFSSVGKVYRYQIKSAPHAGALTRNTHAHVIYPLDDALMRNELRSLVGRHDFGAFASSGSVVKDTVREIYGAGLTRNGDEITFFVAGNGFLYNMVRIIAGTLISVGTGKLAPGAIARAIESRDRLDLGITAPAHGLTLMEVCYEKSRLLAEAGRIDRLL
jgi:tRNA pseudouridine38-40 synthase